MIRLCKDDPNIHGFHPSYPNWKNLVKFLSDAGDMVVLSGKEQEQWLDENNIYYIHVEAKAKESFETFKKRMYRQIEANKEYVESSMSFGKLVYALKKDSYEKGSVNTDNVIEVWRENSDNKYHLRLDLPDNVSGHTYYLLVRVIRKMFEKDTGVGEQQVGISELTSPTFNLFTADDLAGIAVRLEVLEELFKNDRIDVPEVTVPMECDEEPEEYDYDEEEDEDDEDEPDCANCPVKDLCSHADTEEDNEDSESKEEDEEHYYVNGEEVSKEEFEDKLGKAKRELGDLLGGLGLLGIGLLVK